MYYSRQDEANECEEWRRSEAEKCWKRIAKQRELRLQRKHSEQLAAEWFLKLQEQNK